MAMIHGCTGPLFLRLGGCNGRHEFADLEPSAGGRFTARRPISKENSLVSPGTTRVCLLSVGDWCPATAHPALDESTTFMAFVHTHLTLAAVVTLLIGWVAITARRKVFSSGQGLLGPSALLAWLVLFQLALGFGTWICNYALPWSDLTPELAKYTIQAKGFVESWIVTGHQAVGH